MSIHRNQRLTLLVLFLLGGTLSFTAPRPLSGAEGRIWHSASMVSKIVAVSSSGKLVADGPLVASPHGH